MSTPHSFKTTKETPHTKIHRSRQRQRVNKHHICACFVLRRAAIFLLVSSLLILVAYGYKYWMDLSQCDIYHMPTIYYAYLSIVCLECLSTCIIWIAIYCHIRCMVKYSLYWIVIHTLYIPLIFYLTNILNSNLYPLFLLWIAFQFIFAYFLWQYKQLLKAVYDWDDDDDDDKTAIDDCNSHTSERENLRSSNQSDITKAETQKCAETETIATTSHSRHNKTVSVSINLSQMSQPSAILYHPMVPIQHVPSYSMSQVCQQNIPNTMQQKTRTVSEDLSVDMDANDSMNRMGRSYSQSDDRQSNVTQNRIRKRKKRYESISMEEVSETDVHHFVESHEMKCESEHSDSAEELFGPGHGNTCVDNGNTAGKQIKQSDNHMDDLMLAASKPLPEHDSDDSDDMIAMSPEGVIQNHIASNCQLKAQLRQQHHEYPTPL